jgi:hypothetical protein
MDIVLSNDDITVFGPPETVEVLVDIGPAGTRGSQTFVGLGDPNAIDIGQTPLPNDLYINAAAGTNYSYLYQYISEPGGPVWVEVLKMNPAIYSNNYNLLFESGEYSLTIPIDTIVTGSGIQLTADNFNIQYSIINTNPTSSSIVVPALTGDESNLVINFKAVESSSGTWQNLDKTVEAHIFISIVPEPFS